MGLEDPRKPGSRGRVDGALAWTPRAAYPFLVPPQQTIDYDPTEEFVEEGRRALAAGRLEEARAAFEMALRRNPEHPRALLGLAYVERQTEPPPPGGEAVLSVDLEIVELVRAKRYEEALVQLDRALLTRPGDEALSRSRDHIRVHLERKWRKALGGEDAMVALVEGSDHPLARRMPARLGELLADGDPFETLRTLHDWRARGLLRASGAESPRPSASGKRPVAVRFRSGAHDEAQAPPEQAAPRRAGATFAAALVALVLGLLAVAWLARPPPPAPAETPAIDSADR